LFELLYVYDESTARISEKLIC